MKLALYRITGILLIVTAVLGLLFSLAAITQIWRFKPSVENSLSGELDLLDTTLTTTHDGLAIVDRSLETASGNVDSLEQATETLAQSLEDSTPMLDTLISLVGTDLPETITATQTSLESAQTSALLIDNMLATISQIPFLGLGRYRPEVPLNVALGQISANIDKLPGSLETLQESLVTANTNLLVMSSQVSSIGEDIQQINQDFTSARDVIDEYQATILVLQNQVSRAQEVLSPWLTRLAWLLTILLAWLAIMQIGLFTQGVSLLGVEPKRTELETP